MRQVKAFTLALAVAALMPAIYSVSAQMNQDRVVPGGGITVKGWMGKIPDASSIKQGRVINDSKVAQVGNAIEMNIGPAAIYWNPANTAKGDYTVKATFKETNYMKVNDHPHPYGIFIGGSGLDSDKPNFFYCTAQGDGKFITRGFTAGTANGTFRLGEARAAVHEKINKADGPGGTATNEIAVSVKGGRVECWINGAMVAGFDSAQIIGADKLASTDGIAGIRVSHNLDVAVTGFAVTK